MQNEQINAVPGLRVQSSRAGFRRAGRAWTVEPVDLPLDELSEAQVAQLKAEPLLVVVEIAIGDVVAESADLAVGGAESPVPADRHTAIVAAIAGLDPATAANWTASGSPATAALAGVLGWTVTAAERDAAWASVGAALAANG